MAGQRGRGAPVESSGTAWVRRGFGQKTSAIHWPPCSGLPVRRRGSLDLRFKI
jgi:hypothetical protein